MLVRGSEQYVLTQVLTKWSQYVVVDGCRSKLVSGVPQGSVLGPQLFLVYTAELFVVVENKHFGYCDESTLVAVVPTPGERVTATDSLNHDLSRVSMWCDLWGMKFIVRKTMTIIVSRSCKIHPQSTPLTLDGTEVKESAYLVILDVTFDAKITYEKHLLCFQSCSSEVCYYEKILASIS